MPSVSNRQLIVLPGWVGGLNRDADPSQLQLEESPDALNVDFGIRGAVSRRNGYADWSTAPASAILNVQGWKASGGTEYLIAVDAGGNIWSSSASPLVDSTQDINSSDTHAGMASLNDAIYVTSPNTTAPSKFTGSWSTVTATDFDGTASRFPRAKFLQTHVDRIWAANVETSGGTAYRSRLYYSDLLDAETWTATSYIDFDPDDGEEITGLKAFGESIIVFKQSSIQLLSGRSPASFSRYVLDRGIGTESPRTIADQAGLLFFWDHRTGVWQFDGAGFRQIDQPIREYIRDGHTSAQVEKAAGFVWKDRYWLSVPWGSDTYNSRIFCYDIRTQSWTEYSYGVTDFTEFGLALMGSTGGSTSVSTLDSGNTDNGNAIVANFKSAWIIPEGSPARKGRIHRAEFIFSPFSSSTAEVDLYRDFETVSSYTQQSQSMDSTNTVETVLRMTGWGSKRWRAVQFEVSSDSTTDNWQLNRAALTVSFIPRLEGEA